MQTKKYSFNTSFFLLVLLIAISSGCKKTPQTLAASDKYRLIWNTDPETSVTLAWDQLKYSETVVYFDTSDWGRQYWKYNRKTVHSNENNKYGMNTRFAILKNLKPGTNYYFIIKDEFGVSDRFWFKTAPSEPSSFSFIAGGDTKSEGLPLEAGRASTRIVGKLRPLFVIFNGDFTSGNGTNPLNWQKWLTDWQQLTTTADGRLIPIFPVHGNHENGDKGNLHYIFNSPYHNNDSSSIYYSVTIGGNQLHAIALNSEIETGRAQKNWLEKDMKENENCTFKIACYHKPFWPHTTRKRENKTLFNQWGWYFDRYGLDISIDADSHMHKITYPVKPDTTSENAYMSYIRDDENGTMFIGEGSWGATPRLNDDDKPWTMASGSFNQVKWIHIFPEDDKNQARMKIYTIITASYDSTGNQTLFDKDVEPLTEENLLSIPKNIKLFENEITGQFVQYPFKN
ncbi:MAG: metallophosphoesterase [Bacteroidota bacterium]